MRTDQGTSRWHGAAKLRGSGAPDSATGFATACHWRLVRQCERPSGPALADKPPAAPRSSVGRVPRPVHASAGFTFVELMIVVTILAIAAALIVPQLGATTGNRLRSAANLLAADISFAQGESISHGDDPRAMVFDIPANTYRIARQSDLSTPVTDPVTKRPYVTTFGQGRAAGTPGVSLVSLISDTPNQLRFGLYGELSQANEASISLTADGRFIKLTIHPTTGEVTIGEITDTP